MISLYDDSSYKRAYFKEILHRSIKWIKIIQQINSFKNILF